MHNEQFRTYRRVGVLSTARGLALVKKTGFPCDYIEIRLDYYLAAKVPWQKVYRALEGRRSKVIVTLRAPDEGGRMPMTDKERRESLMPFLQVADAVDIEYRHAKGLAPILKEARGLGTAVILSTHFFEAGQDYAMLVRRLRGMTKIRADVYKIASRCDTLEHLRALLRLQTEHSEVPLAVMGMGKLANESRQLLPLLGSKLVYGYLDKATAPGQPSSAQIAAILKK